MAQIQASDWNPLQTTVANIMAGWGQSASVTSAQVNNTLKINHNHYNALKDDINFCYTHITGSNSALPIRNAGTQITQADLTNVSAAVTYINTNKATASSSKLTSQSLAISTTQAYTWSSQLGASYSMTWASASDFNAFFNAGGSVNFSISRSGGAATSQNQSWTNVLSGMGNVYMTLNSSGNSGTIPGAVSITTGINGLSSSNQQFIKVTDQDANYTANYINITAYLDAAPGSARVLTYVVLLVDAHVGTAGGPDTVDGNFTTSFTAKYPYTFSVSATSSFNGVLI
jgi:hypothetical protein